MKDLLNQSIAMFRLLVITYQLPWVLLLFFLVFKIKNIIIEVKWTLKPFHLFLLYNFCSPLELQILQSLFLVLLILLEYCNVSLSYFFIHNSLVFWQILAGVVFYWFFIYLINFLISLMEWHINSFICRFKRYLF